MWYKYLHLPKMKKSLYFLLFLFIGTNCYSQKAEKLFIKKRPISHKIYLGQDTTKTFVNHWEEIVEIDAFKHAKIKKWNTDIYVELQGNYSEKDSLQVADAITTLDSLTEVISIKFAKNKPANFKIVYTDTIVNDIKGADWITSTSSNNSNGVIECKFYIYNKKTTKSQYHNYTPLEIKIAKELVGGHFATMRVNSKRVLLREHTRASIFNPMNQPDVLNKGDMEIIKRVYGGLFLSHLDSYKEELKYVLDEIEDKKNLRRDRSIWWVKNPHALLLLPMLLLLLTFGLLLKCINHAIIHKIRRDWMKFGVLTLIALVFVNITGILYKFGFDYLTTPVEFFNFEGKTLLFFAFLTIIIFPFLFLLRFIELKISKSSQQVFTKTALIFISTGLLPFIVFILLLLYIDGSISYKSHLLSQAFVFLMTIALIRAFISYFIFKERNLIVENETKLSKLKALNAKAELKSLQSQINPHFLYNSLNSIASLAPIDANKTQQMAHSLSDLFKYSINRKGKKTSTIFEEVEMVKTYLEIEKIRFGDRLQFTIDVDEDLEYHKIPLFLIQPLVENAVKHGISQKEGKGEIVLKIEKITSNIIISVSDSGPDFPEGLVSGHGLQTVYDLLRLSYGDKASLNWTNTPEKMITIIMPENRLHD